MQRIAEFTGIVRLMICMGFYKKQKGISKMLQKNFSRYVTAFPLIDFPSSGWRVLM